MLVLTMPGANLDGYKIQGSISCFQVGNLAVGLCCRVGTRSPGARREEEEVPMMLVLIMMMVIAINDD